MLVPIGFQNLMLTGTAQPLTPPAGLRVDVAIISVETADARYRDDGTAPTASVGVRLFSGSAPFIYYGNINKIQLVAVSGSPVVNIEYYRHG